jgi:hypothetical protein
MAKKYNFEEIVNKLAINISENPKTSKRNNDRLLEILLKAPYGQKKKLKNQLIEQLGCKVTDYEIGGSFETITQDLLYFNDIGCTKINKIIDGCPQILELNRDNTIIPKIKFLEKSGVKKSDLGKVLEKFPKYPKYGIEYMNKRVQFLKIKGLKKKQIGQAIYNAPQLLKANLYDMNNRINILYDFNIYHQKIPSTIAGYAMILLLDENKMRSRANFFLGLGYNKTDIGDMITKHTAILAYDIEKNLKPTFKYLTQGFGYSIDEIKENPRLLSNSLKNKVIPRFNYLTKNKLHNRYDHIRIVRNSDDYFCSKVGIKLEDYQQFKKENSVDVFFN